ncbi:MAG: hypothetical protein GYA55_08235 [SAR324 cluster bacterium]|uniref:Uncharacterized protein n=1 Tax=SAR324 cluster bacterium TaxID=2024889 RepID=A0A7X9FRV3_9DELT|nr:hypothetical protein [SAR324 cluster bacterium]
MLYVLPFIKEAIKQGTEIGQQQGRQYAYIKAMKAFLSTRFGSKKAAPAVERLYGIGDSNALESLLEITYKAKTLDKILASYPKSNASPKKARKAKLTKTKTKAATKRRSKAKKPSARKG